MALKPCRECGREVATNAKFCPNCGIANPGQSILNRNIGCSGCLGIVLVLFLIGFVGSLFDGEEPRSPRPTGTPTAVIASPGILRYVHSNLNVREGPGTNHPVVTQFRRGDQIYIGRPGGDGWAAVYGGPRTADTVGFVFAELLRTTPLPEIEVESWKWQKDPGFGVDGAVIWQGILRNNTRSYVESVQVEFTSMDPSGAIVDTDFTYARGLQPGGTASFKSYATYFGNEKSARVRIVDYR